MKTPLLSSSLQVGIHLHRWQAALGRLGAVASTVHLKMRFFSFKDEVITLNVFLDSAHSCHFLSLMSDQGEVVEEKLKGKPVKGVKVNLADLDAQYDLNSVKEEGDDTLTK